MHGVMHGLTPIDPLWLFNLFYCQTHTHTHTHEAEWLFFRIMTNTLYWHILIFHELSIFRYPLEGCAVHCAHTHTQLHAVQKYLCTTQSHTHRLACTLASITTMKHEDTRCAALHESAQLPELKCGFCVWVCVSWRFVCTSCVYNASFHACTHLAVYP